MLVKRKREVRHGKDGGFTILELLIASTVFSVILLVVAVGALTFTAQYYKGVTSSKVQSAAREAMNELAQAIEFGQSVNTSVFDPTTGIGGVCVDGTVYGYALGQQVTDNAPKLGSPWYQGFHGLVAISGGTCTTTAIAGVLNTQNLPAGARELIGRHMRLSAFSVQQNGDLFAIRVRVIYGDSDLLSPAVSSSTDWSVENCNGSSGTQFCAVSDLQTTVERRVL